MADQEMTARKRGVDLLGLMFGLAAMVASAYMLTGGRSWPESLDLRWLFASVAVLIGLGLLVSSLLRQRK